MNPKNSRWFGGGYLLIILSFFFWNLEGANILLLLTNSCLGLLGETCVCISFIPCSLSTIPLHWGRGWGWAKLETCWLLGWICVAGDWSYWIAAGTALSVAFSITQLTQTSQNYPSPPAPSPMGMGSIVWVSRGKLVQTQVNSPSPLQSFWE